jgi:plastocyanin
MIGRVTSHRLVTLLVFAVLAPPAMASDATVNYQCCKYSPASVRIAPGEQVSFVGTDGADFTQHPLRFTNPAFGQEDTGSNASRMFPTDGAFEWYCNIHGVGSGSMKGKVMVTLNHLPVASFTASATNVASGTEVTFDANGSDDPDFATGQTLNYTWDLDGDGADDPGETSPTPSKVFTNTGTAPLSVTVRLTATDTNSDNVGPESATKTMVITVAPVGAPPPPGGGGTVIPPPDTTAPTLHLQLAKSLTVRGKLRVPFTTDEAASVIARLKVGRRTVTVSRDFNEPGRHAITLKLSKAVRRLLRHRRSVTLTLSVTDAAGNGTTVRRILKLKA